MSMVQRRVLAVSGDSSRGLQTRRHELLPAETEVLTTLLDVAGFRKFGLPTQTPTCTDPSGQLAHSM